MAAPAKPREPFDEALQPGGGMTHGRGDLERQGVFGMVVDEIDLVAALAPMVETHLGLPGECVQVARGHVLEEQSHLFGVGERTESSLEGRVPDRAARVLLTVIDREPDAVLRALGG